MILKDKIQNLLVNKFAGVSIHAGNESVLYAIAVLKRVKSKISLEKSASGISDMDEVSGQIDKSVPVWLSLTGKGVISRKLGTDIQSNPLQHLLPNVKEEDFYTTVYQNPLGENFVSAVRKDVLNEYLLQFEKEGYFVFGFSIGPTDLHLLAAHKLITNSEILIPGYRIHQKDGMLTGLETSTISNREEYVIENQALHNHCLLPFSLGLNYFTYQPESPNEKTKKAGENFLYSRLNKYALIGGLALLFLLLLVNFLVFSHYSSGVDNLSGEYALYKKFFVQRDSIRTELVQKQNIIQQSGLSEQSLNGYYADRLAATMTRGITLEKLTINPLTDKIKSNAIPDFHREIYIAGKCNGSLALNEWIAQLKTLEWVTDTEVLNYERLDDFAVFEIQITY